MPSDSVSMHWLWKETDARIESLAKQVREGVGVDEASNFSRWILMSGLLEILQPLERDLPLPIRASELRRKVNDLAYECGEWYRLHDRSFKPRDAYVSQSKLDALERQMARMAEQLEQLAPPIGDTVNAGVTCSPAALRVIVGGRKDSA